MRFWEIDFFRGCAIITMVIYHLLYDLHSFGSLQIELFRGFWKAFQVATASTFLFVAGVSLFLSYARLESRGIPPSFPKYLKRGLTILGWGMVITLFTYFTLGEWYVRFGILHCIGVSTILGYFFITLPGVWSPLLGSVLCFLLGTLLSSRTFPFSLLLPLGFVPHGFRTVDYFPLFPWLGVVLLGVAFGKQWYQGYERHFPFPDWSRAFPIRGLLFLGQHSLTIYLLHQPVLILLLYLFRMIKLPL
ncbi:MAG: heparan-alpha-glucosaminide N-acetyltransferase [Candidatus Caldatribacteriaceae bacterium]